MVQLPERPDDTPLGRIVAGVSSGIAYLVADDLVVTCGHLVQHLVERSEGARVLEVSNEDPVTVDFGSGPIMATIEMLESGTNIALLKLAEIPEGEIPLRLGTPAKGPCTFLYLDPLPDTAARGAILNAFVRDKYGAPRMTVRAPELGERVVKRGQTLSGTPVLVGGRAVGHVVGAVLDPRAPEDEAEGDENRCFAGLVEVVPVAPIERLLRDYRARSVRPSPPSRDAADDLPPGAPSLGPGLPGGDGGSLDDEPDPTDDSGAIAPEIGKGEHHVLVSYRALERRKNDGDWASALMDRLEGLGFSCLPAPHVLFGEERYPDYHKQVDDCRAVVIVYSERWQTGPPFGKQLDVLLKRASRKKRPVMVVRLDRSPSDKAGDSATSPVTSKKSKADGDPFPKELRSFEMLCGKDQDLKVLKQWTPNASVVLEVSEFLQRAVEAGTGTKGKGFAPASPSYQEMDVMSVATSSGEAADGILKAMSKKAPRKVMALAARWLDAGMPGSDVPVEAARVLIGANDYPAALEIIDRAQEIAEERDTSARDIARILRMKALALAEMDRFDEAIEVAESLGTDRPWDQWAGGIIGGTYKKKWMALGRRRRALLQKSYEIYRKAYDLTLHFYPGINAATLAGLLGMNDVSKQIAKAIRKDLEARDDLYFWDEASLGEAYLLLGRFEDAIASYTKAGLMVMDLPVQAASMSRQIPLILGPPREGEDPDLARARDILIGASGIFQTGGVAAFVGHTPDLVDDDSRSLVETRERLIRRRLKEVLRGHDVEHGFCSLYAGSDIVFAEQVLDRGGQIQALLPYPLAAFREDIQDDHWRARFDRIVNDDDTIIRELADQEPLDHGAARADAADAVIDRAMEFAKTLDQKAMLIGVWDGSDPQSVEGRAIRASSDEGLTTVVIDFRGAPVVLASGPSDAAMGSPSGGEPADASGSAGTPTPSTGEGGSVLPESVRGVPLQAASTQRKDGEYRMKHLLVVGIDRYMHWVPLKNARNDAAKIKEMLTSQYGFRLSGELYDRGATRDAIEQAFQNGLVNGEAGSNGEDAQWGLSGEKVHEDDLVVFFFAGHGHTEQRPNGEDVGFLVPVEAPREGKSGMLRISQIREWTEDLPAKHVLYIFDSCFSGVATTGGGGQGKAGYARRVITAGAPDQVVADGGRDFPGNSVFTGRLVKGLDPTDGGLPKPMFAKELAAYLQRHVPRDAKAVARLRQTPSDGVLPGHGGALIVLAPPGMAHPQDEAGD